MPYFSFSIKQNFQLNIENLSNFDEIKPDITYYSKNTFLWKFLNKNQKNLNFINFETRQHLNNNFNKKNILFCLPPSIGMGDAIEYGLAISAIYSSKNSQDFAIAFTGRYKLIFEKYFSFKKIYKHIISQKELKKYDSVFHLSLEIKKLKNQKYLRSDIEDSITEYFNVEKKAFKESRELKKIKIRTINLFPISTSPIRSMPIFLINKIIDNFQSEFNINIILDKSSQISNYIENLISANNYNKIYPNSLEELNHVIEKTEFGIFIDSGPLHLAKILSIKGVLITTSVGGDILLNRFNSIKEIKNNFSSKFCKAPCGLTNLINYDNKIGCYNSLEITSKDILQKENFNSLQRGDIKNKYIDFIIKPVGCIKNINIDMVIKNIKDYINNL